MSDEWYLTYEQLESVIKKRLYEDKETEIMILGCGLSNIGAKLYEEGYLYITNIDFSTVAIEYMRTKHQMYEEMDCKYLTFPLLTYLFQMLKWILQSLVRSSKNLFCAFLTKELSIALCAMKRIKLKTRLSPC